MSDLMTDAEHAAVRLAGELYTHIVTHVIGNGPTRRADVQEIAAQIHHIQHAVMSQAAARAFPDRYRLLGDTVASSPRRDGDSDG